MEFGLFLIFIFQNRLTTDVQDFKSSFKLCVSQGLRSITQTIGCMVSMYLISPPLTMYMASIVPAVIGVGSLLGRFLRSQSQAAQAQVKKKERLNVAVSTFSF
jgi:ATP-binding cassette subfamily B (MDR/TAP) protein 8